MFAKFKDLKGTVRSIFNNSSAESSIDVADRFREVALNEYDEFCATNQLSSLLRCIDKYQQAIDEVDKDSSARNSPRDTGLSSYVHDLVADQTYFVLQLFHKTREVEHLDSCIATLRPLCETKHEPSREIIRCQSVIALALLDRYFFSEDANSSDAQEAVEVAQGILRASKRMKVPTEDLPLKMRIDDAKEIVALPLNAHKGLYLARSGEHHMARYFQAHDMEILQPARESYAEALALIPPTHRLYAQITSKYGESERCYAKITKDSEGLDRAIQKLSSIDIRGLDDTSAASISVTKSDLFRFRFDMSSQAEDLDRAIVCAEQASQLPSASLNQRIWAFSGIAEHTSHRSTVRQSLEDMNVAVEASKTALSLCPTDWVVRRSEMLAMMGRQLGDKAAMFGGFDVLVSSIEALRAALDILPDNHSLKASRKHLLAEGLRSLHYESKSGNMEILNEAVQLEREAVQETVVGNLNYEIMCREMAALLFQRYLLARHTKDLEEAIEIFEKCLVLTKGTVLCFRRQASLAACLLARSRRSRASKQSLDLDRAIQLVSEALPILQNDISRALFATNILSDALVDRYKLAAAVNDLDRAIELSRGVLGTVNPSHPARVQWTSTLALLLSFKSKDPASREDRTLQKKCLHEALSLQEQCVTKNIGHDLVRDFCQLGNLRLELTNLLHHPPTREWREGLILAIGAYEKGFQLRTAAPLAKIRNGRLAGDCYQLLKDWAKASTIFSETIHLYYKTVPLSLSEKDRQGRLEGLSGIASHGCISMIQQGDDEAAVAILEAGLGIMSGIAMRQQGRLPELKEAHPDLHHQYIELRHTLSLPLSETNTSGQDQIAKREQDQALFDKLESDIRQLPGFDGFNQTLTSAQIRALADRGPLVSFCLDALNATGCYALIVKENSIESMPLPLLRLRDVEDNLPLVIGDDRLGNVGKAGRAAANKKMKKLLAWLWDSAIKPVLSHLQLLSREKHSPLPRLWWVMTGEMGLMPLSAAGKGIKDPMENIYAHAVSSHVSTFAALAFAREKQAKQLKESSTVSNVSLITMPQTPGGRAPLGTEIEAQAIRDAFKFSANDKHDLSELCQPTANEVLQSIRTTKFDILHYSGHAEANVDDPSESALLFGKDPTAPVPDFLPVNELRQYHGPSSLSSTNTPQLAYLSACCTALHMDEKLIDESIHLASIFLSMGFPAVIGTLWEAQDEQAAYIAKVFYQELIRLGRSEDEDAKSISKDEHIARSLHAALEACRVAKFKRRPGAENMLAWANFVHYGA